jgi:hypothetical protein
MILAHLFDSASLFHHRNFPRDVLRQTLQHFIPSVDGYLIPRPLACSYYQICKEEWHADVLRLPRDCPHDDGLSTAQIP